MSNLEAIVKEATAEPVELPRLPAAQVFLHFGRLQSALESAAQECRAIPGSPAQNCTDHLKELIKQCESAIKIATRLLEANR